jgi:hypothetical protein
MEIVFYQQILEKYPNIIFYKSYQWATEFLHADGETDRHNEANSHFSQFSESS